MIPYDFNECLKMSMESRQLETDILTLKNYFMDVLNVDKTDIALDKSGVDYIVTLKTGVTIYVDVKTRAKGCSRYWKNGAELALEIWSQKYPPNQRRYNKIGWTLDRGKHCDYVMFKFDKSDTDNIYILPFQQLMKAFYENGREWKDIYGSDYQHQATAEYLSECMFIPASVVCEAVKSTFAGTLVSGDAHD